MRAPISERHFSARALAAVGTKAFERNEAPYIFTSRGLKRDETLKCFRVTFAAVMVASSWVRYPPEPNSVAVDVPIRGTWTVLPAADSAAEKTEEKARSAGSLPFREAMTLSARMLGAATMELAIVVYYWVRVRGKIREPP
jgi:hypothetical protein